jgi:hypothetical protein
MLLVCFLRNNTASSSDYLALILLKYLIELNMHEYNAQSIFQYIFQGENVCLQ